MKHHLVSLGCLVAAAAAAQPYPAKPIEMVSPTSAGGGSDLVARMVADIIGKEKLLSQPVIIQNRAGGGGAVGQTYAASKRGDPYVIFLAGAGLITVPLRTGLDVGLDKFQALGVIGLDLNSLAVRDDSPYRTVKDLVAAAKAKPKTINVAITFPGGSAHQLIPPRAIERREIQYGLFQKRHRCGGCRARRPRAYHRREPGRSHALCRKRETAPARRAGAAAARGFAQCADAEGTGLRCARRWFPRFRRAGRRLA